MVREVLKTLEARSPSSVEQEADSGRILPEAWHSRDQRNMDRRDCGHPDLVYAGLLEFYCLQHADCAESMRTLAAHWRQPGGARNTSAFELAVYEDYRPWGTQDANDSLGLSLQRKADVLELVLASGTGRAKRKKILLSTGVLHLLEVPPACPCCWHKGAIHD